MTLSLGIGANAAHFSFVDRLYCRAPDGVAQPGGLSRLFHRAGARVPGAERTTQPFLSYPAARDIRGQTGKERT